MQSSKFMKFRQVHKSVVRRSMSSYTHTPECDDERRILPTRRQEDNEEDND